MKGTIAIFDIGATLVFGPNQGPASRIAAALSLTTEQKNRLQVALMTRNWETTRSEVDFLHSDLHIADVNIEPVVNHIWSAQESEASPIEGAHAVLSAFVQAGLQIGIVSNIWHPFLTSVRQHFGRFIDEHVRPEHQFYSYREGIAKPSEAAFRRVLVAANVKPYQAVMIGDSHREDIEPADAMGFHTVWLLHRPLKEAGNLVRILNGLSVRPSHALTSIAELEPELVRNLLSEHTPQIAP